MADGAVPPGSGGGTGGGGRRRRLEVGWRRMSKRSGWRGSERTARKSEATSIQQVDLYVYIREFQTLLLRLPLIEWCFSLVLCTRLLFVYVIRRDTMTTKRFVFRVSPFPIPHTRTMTQLNRARVNCPCKCIFIGIFFGMRRIDAAGWTKNRILRKKVGARHTFVRIVTYGGGGGYGRMFKSGEGTGQGKDVNRRTRAACMGLVV